MEMPEAEKASLDASRAAIGDLAHALVEGADPETAEATLAAARQANTKLDLDSLRDKIHMPKDARGFEDGLRRIMLRIPDGWGRWISCSRGWYPSSSSSTSSSPRSTLRTLCIGARRSWVGCAITSEPPSRLLRRTVSGCARWRAGLGAFEVACELCGAPGVRHALSTGWLKTLYPDCATEKGYERLGELVNDLTPDRRGLWKVTDYAGDKSHWDMTHGGVSLIDGERYHDFEVLAPTSVLRTLRIRLADGSEIESGLIAAIERVR